VKSVNFEETFVSAKRPFRLILLVILLVISGLAVLDAQAQTPPVCPLGQGYWANHPESWATTSLMLGTQFYTQAELLAIVPGGGGDASTILAVQLIAAKLNIAAGADPTPISAALLTADSLLGQFAGKLPYNVAPASPEGQAMVNIAGLLESFNSGALTSGCPEATPEATPETTPEATPEVTDTPTPTATPGLPITIIIEGPIETINVNIITIYDIDIEVDINDPILTVIQIGDIVRVEGDTIIDGDTIIVIAIVVVIVDVDVVVNVDGEVWRDTGDCSHGPPDWAPAHGWRRRCEGGGGGDSDDDDDDD
jgi:hypothetical protein